MTFEEKIHGMFDSIWDCEIDHPVFQDTVGELMGAVIQACHSMSVSETIDAHKIINLWDKYHPTIAVDAMKYDSELRQLISEQSKIVRCRDCRYNDGTAYCKLHFMDIKEGDFCSWGEI